MDADVAIACAGVAAGGCVQSATGFGFALIAAPAVAATLGPVVAVPSVSVASLLVSTLTLAGEGRRPVVARRSALLLTVSSVPGMAAGAVVLARAPEDVLRVIVAATVLVSVIAVAVTPGEAARARAQPPAGGDTGVGVAAGLIGGALSTTSGVNGPALLVHLRRIGAGAAQVRDTLAVVFLATGVLTVAVLAVGGTLELPGSILALVAAAAAGQGLGRMAFAALEGHREAAIRFVLALSVAAAAVPAVQALS